MTTTASNDVERSVQPRAGSTIVVSAIVSSALFVVSVALVAANGKLYGSPFAEQDPNIAQLYADNSSLVQLVAFLEFASAIALAVFTAAVWARLRALVPPFATPTYIAVGGGILASTFMGLSALVQWSLSHTSVSSDGAVRHAFEYLFFGLGGFGHVAGLALLVAGVSIPAMLTRLVPRWYGIVSLVVAAAGLLSTLTFLTEAAPASALIPLGRFPTFLWLIATAFFLRRGFRR
jgi:hypothetical protein